MEATFTKIGVECGHVKRAMEDLEVSWGYFFDHSPFEPHCNAHPNNFIVRDRSSPNLLSPIDFDFTFERASFISTLKDVPQTFGTHDVSLFESWLNAEKYELDKALAGDENMANFSYSEGEGGSNELE